MTTPTYYWKWNDGSGTNVANSGAGASGDITIDTVGSGTWTNTDGGGNWLIGSGATSRASITTPAAMGTIWGSTAWAIEWVMTMTSSVSDQQCFWMTTDSGWKAGSFTGGTLHFEQFGTTYARTDSVWSTSTKYHIVLVFDSSNSTSTDRVRWYLNGVRQTATTYLDPGLNATMGSSTTCYTLATNSGGHPMSIDARMRWLAIFGTIPGDAEIATRSTSLLANDDAEPSATPATSAPANSFFSFGGF